MVNPIVSLSWIEKKMVNATKISYMIKSKALPLFNQILILIDTYFDTIQGIQISHSRTSFPTNNTTWLTFSSKSVLYNYLGWVGWVHSPNPPQKHSLFIG